jgi:surfactin synthase thioesterase subunit
MTAADSSPSSAWIRRYSPAPDAPVRLVCLPHAGGSAPFYAGLAKELGPGVDTLAVQYPGRMDRRHERLLTRIDDLAEGLVAELAQWSDRGIAVFGHSLGAVLGFEVARRLEAMDRPPLALFVSGRGAPSRHRREFSGRPDDRTLIEQMRRLGGTDPRVFDNEELVQLALPVIRADYEVVESYEYRPGPPLSCPVIALNGEDDPKVPAGHADAWAEHTTGAFEKFTMPGGHFYLMDRQVEVTGIIADRLARLTDAERV